MKKHQHFEATLAPASAVPTLLCGHCQSTLSRARMFTNEGENRYDIPCQIIALCPADDCGALNSCDAAMAQLENPEIAMQIAS
ncbi:hypothetical protein [Marinobacter zhejiangensis]|uniref:Uncharacterized protein n=1 Tax=Marinobacter zhejiangensis TaxID=488535 RepID=A0A1I4TD19_9GAMM|nr:hypothetical protein [Marinobacter zhejiangensis]SFM74545.1 hypothetical protein SAMN04487963_3563 [Marinobacter zhejiangensis]